jgi:hypothetical protein
MAYGLQQPLSQLSPFFLRHFYCAVPSATFTRRVQLTGLPT